jgi:hypothetical protein
MKAIVKYKAIDGREFITMKDCTDYELLIDRVETIMSRLPKLPKNDECDFANGHGYIQHDKEILLSVWNNLLEEFKSKIDHKWLDESKDMKSHPSWVSRLVGDYGIAPYERAWYRMHCVDKECREFGQPFYATNPDKAELFEIKL